MIDFREILTAGIIVAAFPTIVGVLVAYSIISMILGSMLWAAKSVPDDIGIMTTGSGLITGLLLIAAVVIINSVLF
jgi:hypothetical protein